MNFSESGEASWAGLAKEKYYTALEVAPFPTGYTFVSSEVKLLACDVTITVHNERCEVGSLTVKKFDSINQSNLVATFKLYDNLACTQEATLWDGTTLVGDIVTTGGTATVNNLAYGTYYLLETVRPTGYLADTTVRTVVIPDQAGINVVVNVANCPEGKITITKKDAVDKSVLAGAVFDLFEDEAGTIPAKDALGADIAPQTSDANGIAVFTNLLPGDYWVKELTPPTGYGLAGPIPVTLCCGTNSNVSASGTLLATAGETVVICSPILNSHSCPTIRLRSNYFNKISAAVIYIIFSACYW